MLFPLAPRAIDQFVERLMLKLVFSQSRQDGLRHHLQQFDQLLGGNAVCEQAYCIQVPFGQRLDQRLVIRHHRQAIVERTRNAANTSQPLADSHALRIIPGALFIEPRFDIERWITQLHECRLTFGVATPFKLSQQRFCHSTVVRRRNRSHSPNQQDHQPSVAGITDFDAAKRYQQTNHASDWTFV